MALLASDVGEGCVPVYLFGGIVLFSPPLGEERTDCLLKES